MAGQRIVLLELRSDGSVMEINPATRVTFRDLDKYLDRRLSGWLSEALNRTWRGGA